MKDEIRNVWKFYLETNAVKSAYVKPICTVSIMAMTKSVIAYQKINRLKAPFLIFDYKSKTDDDDQWLYIPATQVRRVSSSERGEYFLGTDFTYDDIQNGGKIEQEDFNFELLGTNEFEGRMMYEVLCVPKMKIVKN